MTGRASPGADPVGTTPDLRARRLYEDLAWTWPIISPPEQYVGEAREFRDFLRAGATGRVREVLHLGCGGGHVDSGLKRYVRITGVDLSPSMLRLARRLNPEVGYRVGDMRSVRLGRTFDGVLISDAVAYMTSPRDLARAFATAYRHLRPGGSFVTYAEHVRERFEQNWTQAMRGHRGGVEIVFVENRYDPDPRDTTFEATFLFLIRRRGRLNVETDRHLLGLFPNAVWRRTLVQAGFQVRHAGPDPATRSDPMSWFVGRRPG